MLTLSGLIVWQIARIWKARQQVKEIQRTVRAEAEEAVRRKEAEMLELEKNLAESQLTALKAQMNPHFLFNSLNSINWYIARNRPNEASRYLTKFSRLIRLILDNSKHQRIPLSGEMEALRLYIEMESIRFEQKFSYEIEMDESLDSEEVTIAPMILQPYVENAIWHGLMPLNGQRPGHLRISITPENGRLHCVIEDNGIGREAAHILKGASLTGRISKGMRITADRITILNQGERIEDLVQITDLTDANGNAAGTRIELKLPYNHEPVDEIR
jgi:LytS/YehU family sensor histidine kinase